MVLHPRECGRVGRRRTSFIEGRPPGGPQCICPPCRTTAPPNRDDEPTAGQRADQHAYSIRRVNSRYRDRKRRGQEGLFRGSRICEGVVRRRRARRGPRVFRVAVFRVAVFRVARRWLPRPGHSRRRQPGRPERRSPQWRRPFRPVFAQRGRLSRRARQLRRLWPVRW
jgi:hypothetical protein